ncbi:MAG: 50S ribosomal protein L10 [Pelotomaculum sp.]|uniref:Large ribosomal subunit protein uL10 n=1 Tax=Pelotomaculum thermopropionicum (strain DSM 13744 / JCM 10971 / SI) TaxID=370438 RepID=RL10_PELTS|nr:RecName: Full=Large ribosomal subunit protein uL10; AltName: Full=50S ribosomal protein L10 [Pelotomaculum thermopropionicum SI]NPV74464.1 50S ribosomal protein L10 [Pelotomaculum sp.]BAF58489.1 ribosomal protein L10 [Pelotomaculum thermopropionicum SI]
MPITRAEKEAIIQELKEKFKEARVAVLADYRGLNVAEATRLRRRLREAGCEFKVAKNTLTGLAARQAGLEGLDPYLEGPIAIAFGVDPVAPAKVLSDFIRETRKMEIKAGVLEGTIIDARRVRDLADLPPREVLLARVLGGMQAPLYGFAGALQGTLRKFIYALEAIRKQKAGEA